MDTKRQQKLARVFQKELADIFQKQGSAYLPNILTTVTKVKVTPDLSIARIFLSFFNSLDTNESIEKVRIHTNEIRYNLGLKIKNQVRIVPHLEFLVDDSNEYAENIERLLNEISKNNKAV